MKPLVQRGFALPEVLAALVVASLAISLFGSFASARIDAEKIRAQRVEGRYIASLVERAHRQGLLADSASTATDLQAALPHAAIPTRLAGGQTYRIALDGDDPRILVDVKTRLPGGRSVIRTEIVRSLLPVSELRIPFWRARQLRQTREEAE
ncbi:MAG: prepilin-type N-terminal cleavage/methylation domain-containing protein [Gammaproteobacteria bacterium]|nr:prepilin-type N-terminal cleavage/methylation domain-containing protein [Gammaproteobacteria bacterium]